MIALIAIASILIFIFFFKKKHQNLPPGPPCLPLIGNIFFFKERLHETLTILGKKYGNIFRIYFGPKMFVVLNDYEAMKEALVKQGEIFSGRPSVYVLDWYHERGGIVLSQGQVWKDLRRFSLTTLRDFGFGKSSLEDRIMVEVNDVVEIIRKHNGKPLQMNHTLDKAMCNVICSMVFDKRFDHENKTLERMLTLMEDVFVSFGLSNPVNIFPPLRFVSPTFKKFKHAVLETRHFVNQIIQEHMETYQPEFLRDFIDVYIQQMKKDEENLKNSYFTKDNFYKIIENFFNAGTETTSTTLMWAIIHMLRNPDVQKKVGEEIQKVIGSSRSVSLSDKINLPYTEATILEIQRIASLAPLSLFHETTEDTTVLNYFIPKNTIIVPNIWAVHYDTRYWPNPMEFKPERFLDECGNVLKNIESFMPFSLGKRACLGDALAKMELFLFFANMQQRFIFTVPNGDSMPSLDNYVEGITLRPHNLRFCAKVK